MKIETLEERIEDLYCVIQEGGILSEKGWEKLLRYGRLLSKKLATNNTRIKFVEAEK